MGKEKFVMLHPDSLATRLLLAAASQLPENPLKHYPAREDRKEVLQVKCKQVQATDYGMVRLVLGEDGRPPAVSVRTALVAAVLEIDRPIPVGFLEQ